MIIVTKNKLKKILKNLEENLCKQDKAVKWIEWANNAHLSEYDPFYEEG